MATGTTDNPTAPPHLDVGYLESLFQSARIAIIACAPDGTIVAWNTAAAKLFGGSGIREGTPVSTVFPQHERESIEEHLQNSLASLEPVDFRCRLGGTHAEPIEYAAYMSPVLEGDGALRGVAVWLRDITARVRLQRLVKKRERLTLLGSLCGAVAHHYNNLLCAVATSVEYALNMNTLAAVRRALRRTTESVARGAHINQQLLTFAQMDVRPRDLGDLTETVLYYFDQNEERLTQRHIKLVLDWQMIPTFPVLREQFLIVIGNLVDNAVEVMPNGGTLAVTLGRRDEDSVCLSIADTGGGMRPEDVEHLFEPFYTTKGTLAAGAGRNPGLGLAVVHGLVSELHGTITASNVPGRGARFDIVLPLRSADWNGMGAVRE